MSVRRGTSGIYINDGATIVINLVEAIQTKTFEPRVLAITFAMTSVVIFAISKSKLTRNSKSFISNHLLLKRFLFNCCLAFARDFAFTKIKFEKFY